jgi:hypothetical protein
MLATTLHSRLKALALLTWHHSSGTLPSLHPQEGQGGQGY